MIDPFLQSKGQSSNLIHSIALSALGKMDKNVKILDLGCGAAGFSKLLATNKFSSIFSCDADVYGSDVSKFNFQKCNLNEDLPYANEQFDVVVSLEVIEHLENPRKFIREVHRITKPGGLILISTPNNESITSLLSLVLRGYFSAFADACYPAHITPILTIDALRMFNEVGLTAPRIIWSQSGRMPGTKLYWPTLIGHCFGWKWVSDNFFIRANK